MISQPKSKIQLAAAVLFGILCLGWTVKGVRQNLDHNDFDVIRMGAELALKRDTEIYDAKLKIKDRHFVYPPAAPVLLIPMALPPLKVAAILSAVLKGLMFAAMALICVRSLQPGGSGWFGAVPAALAAALILFRPVDSDFGNGQVNIHLALLTLGGMLLMLSPSRILNVLGALLFSGSVAIKPPPALMGGALLLQRRWIPLAAVFVSSLLISAGLPRAWFGAEASRHLFGEYASRTNRMLFDAKEGDQVSLHEAIVFAATQMSAPDGLEMEDGKLYIRVKGERDRVKLDDPFSVRMAKLAWLSVAALVGLMFLLGRRRLWGGRTVDPTWDVAALAVFCVLLSPLARKAHLVILIYPVCWVIVRVAAEASRNGWRAWIGLNRMDAGLLMLLTACCWASDDVPIPVPGFPLPLRPALLLAQFFILALLWRLARQVPPSSPGSPA